MNLFGGVVPYVCISLRDLCKCGTQNETKSGQSNAQRAMLGGQSPKPFGLGNVATPAAVSNQWPQSAGQVRPINCSKSRRVFVNWLLATRSSLLVACRLAFASVWLSCQLCCLYLCSSQFLAFHNLTDMRQVIYPPPRPKINSSQCKLLPLGR